MVASTPNTIHPFGEEDSSKRRQILDGAGKVFMDLGFDGASMNDFHTNAASILSRIVVEHLVGLRPTYDGLMVQPAAHLPRR